MKAITLAVTALLAAAFGTMPPALPNQQVLFEKALALEDVHAKLPEAIVLYGKIVYESGDKALAAQAQLRIGICHRKLGAKEAQSAFQKVIDNSDQVETVRLPRSNSRCYSEPNLWLRKESTRFVWSGPGRRPTPTVHLRLMASICPSWTGVPETLPSATSRLERTGGLRTRVPGSKTRTRRQSLRYGHLMESK